MDKPIPEAHRMAQKLASELAAAAAADEHGDGGDIAAGLFGPATTAWLMSLTAAQQQGQVEPIGWTFQHDETGRISFCPNDGVNTPENFAANNPRYMLCGPAYSAPQRQQQGQAVSPRLATPEHIGLYQGPDDCPCLQLNGVSVAIFPAGSWSEVCNALDSITGSTAPQPMQQGGGEVDDESADASVWTLIALMERVGGERDSGEERSFITMTLDQVYALEALLTARGQDPCWVDTAPPSAPVGVEGLPPDVQEIVRQDEAGWALAKLAESHGARRDEDDNGAWWVLDIGHFKALAQQPAACDMGALCIGCEPRNADGSCPGQQPAAVDGGVAQRAAKALLDARSYIGPERPDDPDDVDSAEWWDELTELAAALATQHQEPTT